MTPANFQLGESHSDYPFFRILEHLQQSMHLQTVAASSSISGISKHSRRECRLSNILTDPGSGRSAASTEHLADRPTFSRRKITVKLSGIQ